MKEAVTIFLLLLLATRIAWMVWSYRKAKRRIRGWADENEYAILRLQYEVSWGAVLLFWLVGWVPFYQFGGWHVVVQDNEGGQRDCRVYFGPWWWLDLPWLDMKIRW